MQMVDGVEVISDDIFFRLGGGYPPLCRSQPCTVRSVRFLGSGRRRQLPELTDHSAKSSPVSE